MEFQLLYLYYCSMKNATFQRILKIFSDERKRGHINARFVVELDLIWTCTLYRNRKFTQEMVSYLPKISILYFFVISKR